MAMMTKTKRQLTIRVQFNRNFQEYNTTKKRYRLAKGSAGSGKSVNTAQDYIIKLGDMRYKGLIFYAFVRLQNLIKIVPMLS
ncbi:hypothetical protein KF7HA_02325 [Lactococcus lactis]|nr:hypothetical protein [Lactococcus lactis]